MLLMKHCGMHQQYVAAGLVVAAGLWWNLAPHLIVLSLRALVPIVLVVQWSMNLTTSMSWSIFFLFISFQLFSPRCWQAANLPNLNIELVEHHLPLHPIAPDIKLDKHKYLNLEQASLLFPYFGSCSFLSESLPLKHWPSFSVAPCHIWRLAHLRWPNVYGVEYGG